MRAQLVLLVVVATLLAGLGWWIHSNFEYVTTEVPEAPRGQAVYDPLYAASLALKDYGAKTVVTPFFDLRKMTLGPDDTLVFYSDVRTLAPYEVAWLKNWVNLGGHLVVQLPLGEEATPPLLQSFGMRTQHIAEWVCPKLGFEPGETAGTADVCGSDGISGSAAGYDYSLSSGSALVYAQKTLGRGWLAVVSTMAFMENSQLKHSADLGLMLRVVQPGSSAWRIFLVYSLDEPGLPMLMLRYGWPALAALAALLLAALCAAAMRFGPLRPAAAPPRRALLEHVRAVGEALWRGGGERGLYDAVREDMLLTLRRRHPAAAATQDKKLLGALTEITGLPRLEVRRALAQDGDDLRHGFVQRIATLLEIRKRL